MNSTHQYAVNFCGCGINEFFPYKTQPCGNEHPLPLSCPLSGIVFINSKGNTERERGTNMRSWNRLTAGLDCLTSDVGD
jgi:hypothetical protein